MTFMTNMITNSSGSDASIYGLIGAYLMYLINNKPKFNVSDVIGNLIHLNSIGH